ncbi:PH domain-containing protein [Pallidibacillus pasinlerensis]|uniref:PH domain-containing protein n=1 Tax=Pallidibacillus pasinlerensis TaxID=2703818 RepID=A0ABX0A3L3_9BACI|nr:PH domain-containing protein [Pallidibacillus pasinlerensis]NCU18034.1 PH domain-containing protein [Pallidibacillus pasinlerensis]
MENIPEPSQKIEQDYVKVIRISELIGKTIFLFIIIGLYIMQKIFNWPPWIGIVLIFLFVLSCIWLLWGIFVKPFYLQKSWRYEISEEFAQMKKGIITVTHQVVPMTKVQSVELYQGPILRKYKLFSIKIGTMGTSHEIPGLTEQEAKEIRDTIAHYAKIKEVE